MEAQLHRPIALGDHPLGVGDPLGGAADLGGGAIGRHPVGAAAPELTDRQAGQLADDVPQRDFHEIHGRPEDFRVPQHRRQPLDPARVLADEIGRDETFDDDRRLRRRHGPPCAR